MDNQEYLKQISSTVRPEKKKPASFLSSIFFKVIVGGVAAIVIVIIAGSAITGSKASVKERAITLQFHLENTLSVVSNYQPSVKSSDLRSSSASLSSVLSNTSRDLTEYLKEKYSYKGNTAEDKKLREKAEEGKEELENDLFEAKINGTLDRIFAHKMAFEISLITADEKSIYNAVKSEELKSIMSTSYDSLNNLYDKFNEFSETK